MDVHVSPDYESMSEAAAQRIQTLVSETRTEQDLFALALAGGSTPHRLYELLAETDLPWDQIHLFWGDERFVPHDHPESNVRMVQETLLGRISIPEANVHPVPTALSPDEEAAAYAATLQNAFADRTHAFDLALLGMGEDGHTASLFPEHDPDSEDPKWVRSVSAPPRHDVSERITCTLPVLNATRRTYVLVSGAAKRETVDAALNERDDALPITRVHPREHLAWFLDEAAHPVGSPSS